jgi:hypothetical protein
MRYFVCLTLCAMSILSCKSDNVGPIGSQSVSGTTAINSKHRYVFSFVRGGAEILNPPNLDSLADFDAGFIETGPNGPEPIGICFVGYTQQMFHLVRSFAALDSARTFFQDMFTVADTSFVVGTCGSDVQNQGQGARANQVWSIKTRQNKFAKMLILSNMGFNPNTDSAYAEITFDWVYQPSGSRTF